MIHPRSLTVVFSLTLTISMPFSKQPRKSVFPKLTSTSSVTAAIPHPSLLLDTYCQELLDFMKKLQYGELATIVGRYYAMDRDKRWERIKIAVDSLVGGEGDKGEDPIASIKANYDKGVTDEFMKPIIVNGDKGRIKGQNPILVRRMT